MHMPKNSEIKCHRYSFLVRKQIEENSANGSEAQKEFVKYSFCLIIICNSLASAAVVNLKKKLSV